MRVAACFFTAMTVGFLALPRVSLVDEILAAMFNAAAAVWFAIGAIRE